jgi:hypothetical protein
MIRLVKELLDMGIDHTAMDRNNKTGESLQKSEVGNVLILLVFAQTEL